jgi:hypothetical protein
LAYAKFISRTTCDQEAQVRLHNFLIAALFRRSHRLYLVSNERHPVDNRLSRSLDRQTIRHGHSPIGWRLQIDWNADWNGRILQHASLVVLNTDEYREQLVSCKLVHPNKLLTVYNGFDPSVRQVHLSPRQRGIAIAHFGTLYMDRNPANFFRALDLLLDREAQLMQDLSIDFFGSNLLDVETALTDRRCRAIVRLNAPIPYAEALRRMAAADILLAFAQNQPFQIPAKLFDYIAQKKAILLLGSEGASFNLIRKINAGLCASLNEEQRHSHGSRKIGCRKGIPII